MSLIKRILWYFKPLKTTVANISITAPSRKLAGKRVIVTGGTRGLGYYIAKRFAAEGGEVLITGRDETKTAIVAKEIGCKYFTVSFRFIGILGDFKDHAGFGEELTVEEKRYYIKKSLACLEQLHMRHPQCYKIVVTTDSPYFLKLVKSLSYVYVIPGRLEHMDYAVVDDYEVHLKTFLDFMIITKAEKSYSYQYGKMYGATKFALTAALIGNNEYEVVKD